MFAVGQEGPHRLPTEVAELVVSAWLRASKREPCVVVADPSYAHVPEDLRHRKGLRAAPCPLETFLALVRELGLAPPPVFAPPPSLVPVIHLGPGEAARWYIALFPPINPRGQA